MSLFGPRPAFGGAFLLERLLYGCFPVIINFKHLRLKPRAVSLGFRRDIYRVDNMIDFDIVE